MTFAIAWVARTAHNQSIPWPSPMESNKHTILFPDIGTSDFLTTQDCVRDVLVQCVGGRSAGNSQRVSAFRGASKMPAMAKETRKQESSRCDGRALVVGGILG